jgi:transposase
VTLPLTGAQAHDLEGADVLLETLGADTIIADKAYDADTRVLDKVQHSCIPPKENRKEKRCFDKHLYKERHLIENFFCKLKQYRAIATRYDKTARNFLGAIHLAASLILLN